MEYWEYCFIEEIYYAEKKEFQIFLYNMEEPYSHDFSDDSLLNCMNLLGNAGWELTSVTEHDGEAYNFRKMFFKRKRFR